MLECCGYGKEKQPGRNGTALETGELSGAGVAG